MRPRALRRPCAARLTIGARDDVHKLVAVSVGDGACVRRGQEAEVLGPPSVLLHAIRDRAQVQTLPLDEHLSVEQRLRRRCCTLLKLIRIIAGQASEHLETALIRMDLPECVLAIIVLDAFRKTLKHDIIAIGAIVLQQGRLLALLQFSRGAPARCRFQSGLFARARLCLHLSLFLLLLELLVCFKLRKNRLKKTARVIPS